MVYLWLGHPEIALERAEHALRHDPHYSIYTALVWNVMEHACFFLGKHDDAVSWAEGELQQDPDAHGALRIGAAAAAHAGNLETARTLGRQLQAVDPAFRVSRLGDYLGPYQKPEFVAKYAEGLRMAGLPE